jgi:hypothetical protein
MYRATKIGAVLLNVGVKIFGKIFGFKKIENQICKNDEIDRIQNIFIQNLDERVKKIENNIYGK